MPVDFADINKVTLTDLLNSLTDGIEQGEPAAVVRRNYYKISRQIHPDKHNNSNESANLFKELNNLNMILNVLITNEVIPPSENNSYESFLQSFNKLENAKQSQIAAALAGTQWANIETIAKDFANRTTRNTTQQNTQQTYAQQQNNRVPRNAIHLLSKEERKYYRAGVSADITKNELKREGDTGHYLIRESLMIPGLVALDVKLADGRVETYNLFYDDRNFYDPKGKPLASLSQLIDRVVTQNKVALLDTKAKLKYQIPMMAEMLARDMKAGDYMITASEKADPYFIVVMKMNDGTKQSLTFQASDGFIYNSKGGVVPILSSYIDNYMDTYNYGQQVVKNPEQILKKQEKELFKSENRKEDNIAALQDKETGSFFLRPSTQGGNSFTAEVKMPSGKIESFDFSFNKSGHIFNQKNTQVPSISEEIRNEVNDQKKMLLDPISRTMFMTQNDAMTVMSNKHTKVGVFVVTTSGQPDSFIDVHVKMKDGGIDSHKFHINNGKIFSEEKIEVKSLSQYINELTTVKENTVDKYRKLDHLIKKKILSYDRCRSTDNKQQAINELKTIVTDLKAAISKRDTKTMEKLLDQLSLALEKVSTEADKKHQQGFLGKLNITKSRVKVGADEAMQEIERIRPKK